MAIELKEIMGYDPFTDAGKYKAGYHLSEGKAGEDKPNGITFKNSIGLSENKKHAYTVKIEAMHCHPYATGNHTRYMASACAKSLKEWISPYAKPVIMYHNDQDGILTGRIKSASVGLSEQTGGDCLFLEATVPLREHQDQIDGELLYSTSIGADGTDVRCSICGTQLANGDTCEHKRGYKYNGETCYWDVYEFTPKECSYVITPSDKYARVVSVTRPGSAPTPIASNESQKPYEAGKGIPVKESEDNLITPKAAEEGNGKTPKNKENHINNMTLEEAQKNIDTLELTNKALTNDKVGLQEQVKSLTNDKLALQESLKAAQDQVAAKDSELSNEKQLREQLEKDYEEAQKEVKTSLVETFTRLRESAGYSKIEKLEERSIESLRNSISDLKADIEAKQLTEAQQKTESQALSDTKEKAGSTVANTKTDDEPKGGFMGL